MTNRDRSILTNNNHVTWGVSFYGRRQLELNQHNSITVTYSSLRNRSNPQPFTNAALSWEGERILWSRSTIEEAILSFESNLRLRSFHREKWEVNGTNNNVSGCDSILWLNLVKPWSILNLKINKLKIHSNLDRITFKL